MIRKLELILDLIFPISLIVFYLRLDNTMMKVTVGLYLFVYLFQYALKFNFYKKIFNLKTHILNKPIYYLYYFSYIFANIYLIISIIRGFSFSNISIILLTLTLIYGNIVIYYNENEFFYALKSFSLKNIKDVKIENKFLNIYYKNGKIVKLNFTTESMMKGIKEFIKNNKN